MRFPPFFFHIGHEKKRKISEFVRVVSEFVRVVSEFAWAVSEWYCKNEGDMVK